VKDGTYNKEVFDISYTSLVDLEEGAMPNGAAIDVKEPLNLQSLPLL
jgi:hypothetical protein